jgi:transglutaminase-like putative cysteine protease
MRIRVSHLTTYRYERPATSVIQMLRLTPRNHDGQYVARWRIDVSTDCRLDQHDDAFGNIAHAFTADGPLEQITILVEGEVETRDTQGVIRGTVERFPPSLYLRETALTHPDAAISAFAVAHSDAAGGDVLKTLHRVLDHLHEEIALDGDPARSAASAAEAFTAKRGSCQDPTHIFIAASRSLGIPARYIGGYFRREDGASEHEAGHAWAEAFVPGLGWVAFDAASGMCPTDAYIRVAVGLDQLGGSPLRGTNYGGAGEVRSVKVRVAQASQQTQN